MKVKGVFLLAASALVLIRCATDPAPPAGFVEHPDAMKKVDQVPFQRVWIRKGIDWSRYESIHISPVSTDFLRKREVLPGGSTFEEALNAAAYMELRFKQAFREDSEKRYRTVGSAGQNTLVLELAVVEVTPRMSAGEKSDRTFRGSLAFEGRLKDGGKGTVLAAFADRQVGPPWILRPGMGYFGHVNPIVDDWAKAFVRLANKAGTHPFGADWPFDLKTWPK